MTLVDIGRIVYILEDLEQAEKKSNRLYEETGQTGSKLDNFSGMQQVKRTIEFIMEDMKEECQIIDQMSRCLEEVCIAFSHYEEEITEYAEESGSQSVKEPLLEAVRIPENLFRLLR